LSILLIFALLIQSTGYLCIVGMFKLNQDYIAKNLCINRFDAIPICMGSCYLEDQFNSKDQQQQNAPDFKNAEAFFYCEQLVNKETSLHTIAGDIQYPEYGDYYIPSGYIHAVFHPPAAAAVV
jgi:hypothetical protein